MKYEHLTAADIERLHAKSFNHFFFRWDYLRENAALLWPMLRHFRLGRKKHAISHRRRHPPPTSTDPTHSGVPQPKSGLEFLKRKGFRPDGPHVRPKGSRERKEK